MKRISKQEFHDYRFQYEKLPDCHCEELRKAINYLKEYQETGFSSALHKRVDKYLEALSSEKEVCQPTKLPASVLFKGKEEVCECGMWNGICKPIKE